MTDDWLKDALENAVADVEPEPALDRIRARTKGTTPMSSKRPWLFGAAGAVLATAATITAFAVLGNSGATPQDGPGPADSPSTATEHTPTEDPTTTDPRTAIDVPVYYLGEVTFTSGEGGETQTGFRLYREWHPAPGLDESSTATAQAQAAVQAMLTSQPFDPDYSSPWADGVEVSSVTHEDGTITVDLTGPVEGAGVGAETAELAVQQLVYTVQGALAHADDGAATDPVRILVDGEPGQDLWGHVDISAPITRADPTGIQAPLWITSPVEGATTTSPVQVRGVAQVFEATVSWRVLQQGTVVAENFTTASEGAPGFGDFSFEVPLEPGTYTIEVFESSALDGSATFVEDKQITVE